MVDEARTANHTWAQIAEALGISRQAAQARFGGTDRADAAAPPNERSPADSRDIQEQCIPSRI